ncbi:hypothetical protein [uncultured Paraglaciecola sp.]|uniref:hypothetical protein n=1 Tax=uncultured Paraglaciecola sp. TaxID=1765024 RepID=UPI00263778B7|nr:hypothetical protein [uncultured Paraglaciecola sp.]
MAGFNPNTWPTYQQSMPMAQGAMTGEALQRAYLQNQMQRQQNQAQPDLNAAKLSQMQSATEGQNISNEQAPELMGLKEYMAQISAQNAARGLQNIGLQRDKMGALYTNAFSRFSNTPTGQTLLANDPNAQQNALAGSGAFNQQFAQLTGAPAIQGYSQPSPQQQAASQQSQQYQPIPAPNFPTLQKYMQGSQGGQQAAPPSQQYIQGSQQAQPQGQRFPQPAQQQVDQAIQQPQQNPNISPDLVRQAQDANASRMQKQNVSGQTANQRRFAVSLNKFGNTIEEKLPLVSRYFGVGGKANLLADKALVQSGKQPESYDIYQELVKTNFPDYANEFGRAMGIGATDKQKEAIKNVVNPDWMMSNPDLAFKVFKTLRKDESDMDEQLAMSPAQVQKYLASGGAKPGQKTQEQAASPSGTVEMVDNNGTYYAVNQDDVDGALKYGWRKA